VVAATWAIERDATSGTATLAVHHVPGLTKRAQAAIVAEGRRFVRFHESGASAYDVRLAPVRG
jgi:hypothetical protein